MPTTCLALYKVLSIQGWTWATSSCIEKDLFSWLISDLEITVSLKRAFSIHLSLPILCWYYLIYRVLGVHNCYLRINLQEVILCTGGNWRPEQLSSLPKTTNKYWRQNSNCRTFWLQKSQSLLSFLYFPLLHTVSKKLKTLKRQKNVNCP